LPDHPAQTGQSQVTESDSPDHENPGVDPSLGRVERFLERRRRTPAGRLAVRLIIALLGLLIIAVGIVLLPLPGPGWLIIFGGLALWSLEFTWAARLRHFAMREVSKWTAWVGRQRWWVRVLVGVALFIVVAAIVAGSLAISLGGDFISDIQSFS
jgi:TIGR02611 family protein